MTFSRLICAFKLIKTSFSELLCANINEHVFYYVYYLVESICYRDSNSTHIWHFLPTGYGERQKSDNVSKQTACWCKGGRLICTNLAQSNLSPLHQTLDKECPQVPAQ